MSAMSAMSALRRLQIISYYFERDNERTNKRRLRRGEQRAEGVGSEAAVVMQFNAEEEEEEWGGRSNLPLIHDG